MQNLQMTDISTTGILNPSNKIRNVYWGTAASTLLTIHKEVTEIPNLGPTFQLCIHEALVILNIVSGKQFKVLQAVEYKLSKLRSHIFCGSKGCQNTSLQKPSTHAAICTGAWKVSCSYNAPPTPPSSMPLYCIIRMTSLQPSFIIGKKYQLHSMRSWEKFG